MDEISSSTNVTQDVGSISDENNESWQHFVFHELSSIKDFYAKYAHEKGFSVRRNLHSFYDSRNKKTDIVQYIRYVCNKHGFKHGSRADPKNKTNSDTPVLIEYHKEKELPEERTGCPASISLKYDSNVKGYHIYKWNVTHNHPLHKPEHSHYLRSAREISEPQKQLAIINSKSGMSVRSSFQVMRQIAGGSKNLGYCFQDLKNFLTTVRQKEMVIGDATIIQEYLRNEALRNPSFYYDIQVDSEENIASIFWSDAIMQQDYELFGDLISFDTTYRTNTEYRPLAPFLGFDNHRKSVLFGCALLYDETSASFDWLFTTFLKCMKNKKPITIYTDQASALMKSVPNIFPDVFHGLCSWHMGENAKSNLGSRCNGAFLDELHHLVSNVDDEAEFDFNWNKMLQNCFGGKATSEFTWLVQIHRNRTQWSSAWVKSHFTAGLKTTQLSESFNAFLRHFLQPDHSLVQFFIHFNVMVEKMRDNHADCDFKAANTRPRNNYPNSQLMRSVVAKYTPASFAFIHKQYDLSFKYYYEEDMSRSSISNRVFKVFTIQLVRDADEMDFDNDAAANVYMSVEEVPENLLPNDQDPLRLDERVVTVDIGNKIFTCTCRMFENRGFLCRHVFKILDFLGSSVQYQSLKSIPEHYILKRWTKGIRPSLDALKPISIGGIQDTTFAQRYQQASGVMLQIITRVCMDPDACQFFLNAAIECGKQAEELIVAKGVSGQPSSSRSASCKDTSVADPLVVDSSVKKFKKRPNPIRAKKRLKSDYELARERQRFIAQRKKQKKEDDAAKLALTITNVD
ncbi:protein FAR1-RELATED SEQUENCE 5-like [Vicia villosa]|uniref:protein FAR1-RELATED SEQUENCE 5-like n=1 Tax=Vicia villosa TaxID=3911 RepID=UPI00273B8436|nr:protein FAR1-RELATED SEQUENCE 5-like [Vicia villosa]